MKKAWERAGELYWHATPVILSEEDQTWTANLKTQRFYDQILSLDWGSHVPGSGADYGGSRTGAGEQRLSGF